MNSTALRLPELEWSVRSATGELQQLSWVDTTLRSEAIELSQVDQGGGQVAFTSGGYLARLPGPILQAAQELQASGRVGGWEVLSLIFSRMEWMVASRRYLWSPSSPVPRLLSTLVHTFGVEATCHANDPERLARLTALLPTWHPHRGTVARAREVLETCGMSDQLEKVRTCRPEENKGRGLPLLSDEVFACHDQKWWENRHSGEATPVHRIEDGVVRFQPQDGDNFELRREDVLVTWKVGRPIPREAIRLLPAWTVVRLAAPTGRKK